MKKLGLTLLAAIFSLQLFATPPVSAKIPPETKQEIKALRKLIKHSKDKSVRQELKALIKQIKASAKA